MNWKKTYKIIGEIQMGTARKTVLFIVEGSSDKAALEKIFKAIYKKNKNIDFRFAHGDISSDENVTVENVCDKIYRIADEFMKDRKLKKSDIWQIVQIFDTDGAYIPEYAILWGDTSKFVYTLTNITCRDINKVKERNKRKKEIMDFLLAQDKIKSLPYEIYFMSCNLDHALYNKQNLEDDKKQGYADAFYEKFIGKEIKFIDFLQTDVVNGTPNSYLGSWRYIKEELHSLERHTNLHVYFIKNPLPQGF